MKICFSISVFALLCLPGLFGQYDCKTPVPDSIQALYQIDAEQILVRKFAHADFKKQNFIDLPQAQIQPILSSLLALYGDNDLPHWEEVIKVYQIHTRETVPMHRIKLVVDTALLWTDPLDLTPLGFGSGDFELDRLLSHYNFELLGSPEYFEASDGSGFFLELDLATQRSLNLEPLLNQIRKVEGVHSAKAQILQESSEIVRDIIYENHDAYTEITFQLNWDCHEGNCGSEHSWIYRVYPDCRTTFEKEEGALLPVKNLPGFISTGLYPNPTVDEFFVQVLAPSGKDIQVVLLSAMGQILLSESIQTQSGILQLRYSLRDFPVGMYFLGLMTGDKVLTEKIIKR